MRRKVALAAGAAVAMAGTVALSLPVITNAAVTPAPDSGLPVAVKAASAADRLVAEQPQRLHKSSADTLVQRSVVRQDNLQYVSYERTYRGLPVRGGDAVVVTDVNGQVLSTSVAQNRELSLADLNATVKPAAAVTTARRQLVKVSSATRPVLTVVAQGSGTLAYEVVVEGTKATDHGTAPSKLHVFVDAKTGKVIADATYDEILAATGTGYYNGTVTFNTSTGGSGYRMVDASRPGLQCGGQDGQAFTKTTDTWGNGQGTNLETACVDVMYAAAQAWDMLSAWLGRNGFNGSGRAFPARVGLNQVNAFWNGSYTNFGKSQDGQRQVTPMDVVAHEYGHAIFQNTPGGAGSGNENGGLNESTGDIFGALTEHYANNPKDRPDYDVGELVNLVGSGPIRYMNQPSRRSGDPNCYSSAIPNTEVHSAAGPMNHWFYLLAEGTNPTNGNPTSPTCNNTTITGIGIQAAGKIFMGALSRKTSTWNHAQARLHSVQSAIQLYPNSNRECATVKAAWSAVSVNPGSSEPACPTG
ncbi:MAG TPA: M4 family metallopeptidase, partial [Pilimelia sp.]|nr:M4 family metallopeptidase [Pilimelia sp.]